jgi:hypothetical protein
MTSGGINDESLKVHIVYVGPSLGRVWESGYMLMCLPDTKPKPQWIYATVCLGIRTPRKNSLLVD